MTAPENTLERHAAEQLREAGFPFVQMEARLPGLGAGRALQADIVAWDVGEEGELRPAVLVEVKRGFGRRLAGDTDSARDVFRQVSAYANAFGTRQVFVMDESGWYRVAGSFDFADPSERPSASGIRPTGPLPAGLVAQVVSRAAGGLAKEAHEAGKTISVETLLEPLLAQFEATPPVPQFAELVRNPRNGPAILSALLRDVFPRAQGRSSYMTPWAIAQAMARLARPEPNAVVQDPFCGLGACLWAIAEQSPAADLRGSERDGTLAEFTARLGALADYRVHVEQEDALLRTNDVQADVIVSDPPIGRKLTMPQPLASGGSTKDGELVVLDRCHQWIRPGGRAVLLLAPGVLFRGGPGERVRSFVQSNARISALISLPPGVLKPYAMIAPVLLVLDKTDPGETLVARLGDDWVEQLGPTGEFFKRFLRHTGSSE